MRALPAGRRSPAAPARLTRLATSLGLNCAVGSRALVAWSRLKSADGIAADFLSQLAAVKTMARSCSCAGSTGPGGTSAVLARMPPRLRCFPSAPKSGQPDECGDQRSIVRVSQLGGQVHLADKVGRWNDRCVRDFLAGTATRLRSTVCRRSAWHRPATS